MPLRGEHYVVLGSVATLVYCEIFYGLGSLDDFMSLYFHGIVQLLLRAIYGKSFEEEDFHSQRGK